MKRIRIDYSHRTQDTPSQEGLPNQCYLCSSRGASTTCGTPCSGLRSTVDGSCCQGAVSTVDGTCCPFETGYEGCADLTVYYDFCPNTQPQYPYPRSNPGQASEGGCRQLCDSISCYSYQWYGQFSICYMAAQSFYDGNQYNAFPGLDSAFARQVIFTNLAFAFDESPYLEFLRRPDKNTPSPANASAGSSWPSQCYVCSSWGSTTTCGGG